MLFIRHKSMSFICQRARSSRTRIKTYQVYDKVFSQVVREHGPVEQGLRLSTNNVISTIKSVREHGPVEQGLRPIIDEFTLNFNLSESTVQ